MVTRLHPKLAARYYRSYLVHQQIGAVTLKLQLPKQKLQPSLVFQLQETTGNHLVESELPADL